MELRVERGRRKAEQARASEPVREIGDEWPDEETVGRLQKQLVVQLVLYHVTEPPHLRM